VWQNEMIDVIVLTLKKPKLKMVAALTEIDFSSKVEFATL